MGKRYNDHGFLVLGAVGVGSVVWWFFGTSSRRSRQLLPPDDDDDDDDVEYPPHRYSWIPFVGKALELSKMPTRDFIMKYSNNFQDPMFTCTVMGQKSCFLVDPALTLLIYRDRPELDFNHLGDQFLKGVMGVDDSSINIRHNLIKGQSTNQQLMHKHFLKRESLADRIHVVQQVLIEQINQMIIGDDSGGSSSASSSSTSSWSTGKLYELVCSIVFKATIASIVGDHMTQDQYVQDFLAFDDQFPLLFSNAPKFMTTKSREARERLVKAFASQDYAESDQTPFIKERTEALKDYGIPDDFHIRQHMSFMWVSVANSMPGIFWTIYYLLTDKVAYKACLEQVESVLSNRDNQSSTTPSPWFTLDELDQMTILNSVFLETLRLKQVIYSARLATKDFVYNPKDLGRRKFMIQKGTRVMACPTLVHYDPEIFEDPDQFKYNRFMDPTTKTKEGKLLTSYIKAFGGGSHLCSGRKFITYETQALIAMMLTRLDFKLVDIDKNANSSHHMDIQYSRQGIGVPPPIHDPMIDYRGRKETET